MESLAYRDCKRRKAGEFLFLLHFIACTTLQIVCFYLHKLLVVTNSSFTMTFLFKSKFVFTSTTGIKVSDAYCCRFPNAHCWTFHNVCVFGVNFGKCVKLP